jgi:hypothetical protein
VALALGSALKRLGGLLRPMFLSGVDPVSWDWWLLRLVNASWLEVSSALKVDRLMVLFFFSGDGEGLVCLVVAVMVVYNSLLVCILLMLCCLYAYQLCIVMFMNTSNVCLRAYIVKKHKEINLMI